MSIKRKEARACSSVPVWKLLFPFIPAVDGRPTRRETGVGLWVWIYLPFQSAVSFLLASAYARRKRSFVCVDSISINHGISQISPPILQPVVREISCCRRRDWATPFNLQSTGYRRERERESVIQGAGLVWCCCFQLRALFPHRQTHGSREESAISINNGREGARAHTHTQETYDVCREKTIANNSSPLDFRLHSCPCPAPLTRPADFVYRGPIAVRRTRLNMIFPSSLSFFSSSCRSWAWTLMPQPNRDVAANGSPAKLLVVEKEVFFSGRCTRAKV